MIPLKWVLESAGLSQEQLVDMSIMIGTNFNPTGLYGIGPKKALKIIEKHGQLEDTPQVRRRWSPRRTKRFTRFSRSWMSLT